VSHRTLTCLLKTFAPAHPPWPEIGAQVIPYVTDRAGGSSHQPRSYGCTILRWYQVIWQMHFLPCHLTEHPNSSTLFSIPRAPILKKKNKYSCRDRTIETVNNFCGCNFAILVGSNPTRDIDVCLL